MENKKTLREYIASLRISVTTFRDGLVSKVEAPIERVDRFVETGSAHFNDGLKRLVALRHKSNPLLAMSGLALIVAVPIARIMGPGAAIRYGTIAFTSSGIILYPDYVIHQVEALTNEVNKPKT